MGRTGPAQPAFGNAYQQPGNHPQPQVAPAGQSYTSPPPINQNSQWPPPPPGPPPADPWGRTSVPPANPPALPFKPNQYGYGQGSSQQQAAQLPPRAQEPQQPYAQTQPYQSQQQPPPLPQRPMSIPPTQLPPHQSSAGGYQPDSTQSGQAWPQNPRYSNAPLDQAYNSNTASNTYQQYAQDGRQSVPLGQNSGAIPPGPPPPPPKVPSYPEYEQKQYQASSSTYATAPVNPTAGVASEQYPSYPPAIGNQFNTRPPVPPHRPESTVPYMPQYENAPHRPESTTPYVPQYAQPPNRPESISYSSQYDQTQTYGGAGYQTQHQQQSQTQQSQYPDNSFSQTSNGRPSPQQNFARPSEASQVSSAYNDHQKRFSTASQHYSRVNDLSQGQEQNISPVVPHPPYTQLSATAGQIQGTQSFPQPNLNAAYGRGAPTADAQQNQQYDNHASQAPNQSQQQDTPISAYNQYNQPPADQQTEPAEPVSPIHRLSFDQSFNTRPNVSGIPSRSESVMSRKSVAVPQESSPQNLAMRPATQTAPSTFTFSSFGGPGDWEHYGEGPDEIDDTAMYGVKHDNGAEIRAAVGVELPAEVPLPAERQSKPPEDAGPGQAGTAADGARGESVPNASELAPPAGPHEMASPEPVIRENIKEDPSTRISVQMPPQELQKPEEPSAQSTLTSFPVRDGGSQPVAPIPPPPPTFPMADGHHDVLQLLGKIQLQDSTITEMQTKIEELQKTADQQRQYATEEARTARLTKHDLNDANTLLEQAKESLSTSQLELESTKSRVQQLEADLSESKKALQASSDKFEINRSALQKSLSDSEASLTDARKTHDTEKQQLQAKVTEMETSIAAVRAAADTASAEHQTAKSLADEQSQEIETLKKKVEESTAEAQSAKLLLEEEKKNKPADILAGLDPWFRGSLERFKASLEIEATAPTVQEKLGAFISFVNNESRLRGVNMPFTAAGEAVGFQLPPAQPQQAPPAASKDITDAKPKRLSISTSSEFVMVHTGGFSPGGRPIMEQRPALPQIDERRESLPANMPGSVPDSGAAPVDDGAKPTATKGQYRPYRGGSLPSSSDHSIPKALPKVDTQQPAYKPLSYKSGAAAAGAVSQTPIAERVKQPVIARNASSTPAVPTVGNVNGPELELFTDPFAKKPVPNKPQTAIADEIMVPPPLKPKTPAPLKPETKVHAPNLPPIEQLASLLPPLKMPHPSVSRTKSALLSSLASFPSDYSFIATMTKDWEKQASITRNRLDGERHTREEANEQHNNDLFESDEIGYGDIKDLEDQQKAEEWDRKAAEERDEYDSYAKEVFGASFKQLQEQIAGLMDLYARAERVLKEGVAGGKALHIRDEEDDVEAGEVMGVLLEMHNAIEERHAQVVRCVAERDRRFKRTQTSTLYRRGEVAEMKRVEKGFEANERRAEVKAAVEKVERCKKLWKVTDTQSFKGVNENQEYIEQLLKAVDAVADEDQTQKSAAEKKEVTALLHQARDAISTVAGNSKRLMQFFEVVEMDLNECEYNVSVTSARLDGREPAFFAKLQGEKQAEDAKLKEESVKRLKAIDDDLKEAQSVVDEALSENDKGGAAPADIDGEDEQEKQRRLKAALEAAKRRNGEIV